MNQKLRTTLLASAIATLLAGPVWATSETPRDGASATPATPANGNPIRSGSGERMPGETGQTVRGQPTDAQSASEAARMGGSYVGTTARTSPGDNPLYARSADDLDGVEVVDRNGDKVGDVTRIVLTPDRKRAHAVISVGGILGIGASEIMISLDDLTPIGDSLQMSATKSEATAPGDEAPDADRYVEVTGAAPISGSIVDFSAFEQDKDASEPDDSSMTPKAEGDQPGTTPAAPGVRP